jgi:hypothetical protein
MVMEKAVTSAVISAGLNPVGLGKRVVSIVICPVAVAELLTPDHVRSKDWNVSAFACPTPQSSRARADRTGMNRFMVCHLNAD